MLIEFDGYTPDVHPAAFIAPTAVLIGNVTVGEGASVWYGAVLRADHRTQGIVVGARTSVQDNCVIHVSHDNGTVLGEGVTVGHGAILEGCTVDDGALIGMNAVVLDGAHVGAGSLVAANSTVLANTDLPDHVLAAGSPAAVKREISGSSHWWIENSATYYVELAGKYRDAGLSQT